MRCRPFAVVLSGLSLFACALPLCFGALAEGKGHVLVIRNVRVFDGARVTERSTVVVQEGKVAAVGPDAEVPAGADVIDGSGQTFSLA
jgi:cytosine/adenosine deaminase-related metal-dependent hydrolase